MKSEHHGVAREPRYVSINKRGAPHKTVVPNHAPEGADLGVPDT